MPIMVYRSGSRDGHPFDYKIVEDDGYASALSEGWVESPAHIEITVIEAAEALEDAIDDVSPATRDELEQRAKALGVSFNKRTADAVLVQRIAEAS